VRLSSPRSPVVGERLSSLSCFASWKRATCLSRGFRVCAWVAEFCRTRLGGRAGALFGSPPVLRSVAVRDGRIEMGLDKMLQAALDCVDRCGARTGVIDPM